MIALYITLASIAITLLALIPTILEKDSEY
jgi:hypothetical protein